MKHLIPIIKELEIELRSNNGKIESKELWGKLSELPDWDYRIVQDAMLRVRIFMKNGDDNFAYKYFEKNSNIIERNKIQKYDITIALLKRDQADICLTDAWNSLIVPPGMSSKIIEIWGEMVTRGRNHAIEQAMKFGSKYILFIDDDIVAPNNALHKLHDLITTPYKDGKIPLVVSGLYYKKYKPLSAPFENESGQIFIPNSDDKTTNPIQPAKNICGMGFCLIDLEEVSKQVPFPLFWEFGAPDGFWSMGEDAFFTQNLVNYTGSIPLVDTSIKCMHMDKKWKILYGERDNEVVYSTGIWDHTDIKAFERMRVPPSYPFILICIPGRSEQEPIAVDLENLMLLRGYRSEFFRIIGKGVDEARNICAQEALKRGADYLLFIDNDVIPPQYGLIKLLETMEQINDPCVVSGNYSMKGNPPYSASTQLEPNNKRHPGLVTAVDRTDKFKKGKVFESNWLIGLGFALIDIAIFKQARQPWFVCYQKGKEDQVNEDAHFTELCFENGYKVYINPEIECLHVDFRNQVVYGELNRKIKYAGFEDILKKFKFFKPEGIK